MAIEPIKGFYVHDEATDTDGVAKIAPEAVEGGLYIVYDGYTFDTFEQGSLSATGVEIDRANRIRTSFIDISAICVNDLIVFANSDLYKFGIAFYSANNASAFINTGTAPNDVSTSNNELVEVPTGAKFVRIVVSYLGEGVINPSNVSGTEFLIQSTNVINRFYNAFKNYVYPYNSLTFKKGGYYANGTFISTSNSVVTNILSPLNTAYIKPGCISYLLLYRGSKYIGKVSTSGTVDQTGGTWKSFSGLIDVAKLLNDADCDGIVFYILPDNATISSDEDAVSFGESHVEFSTTTATQNYVDSKTAAVATANLEVPNITSFNLCAHRGSTSTGYHDNSITAFERAISLGYKCIETDINWTQDGVCILYHDNDIDGTAISSLTYAQIHALDAEIPTLEEALKWAKKYKCFMVLDCLGRLTSTTAPTLYNIAAQYGMLDNIILSIVPELAYDMSDADLIKTNVIINFYGRTPSVAMINAIDAKVDKFKNVMTGYNKDDITSEIILASHLKGFPVEIATINEQSEVQTYYNMGVDMLVCNGDTYYDVT